jgi:hemerythrin superfamily protein
MNTQEIDAVELLVDQHRKLEHLLAQVLDETNDEGKMKHFAKVSDELTVHIKSEEEIFYPAVKAVRTEDDLLESLEEHLSLKRLLADLIALDLSDKTFEAKFKVLKEQTEHHHKEEEEHLFPAVLKLIGEPERAALGREMLTLQKQLMREGEPRDVVANETSSAAPLQ